MAHFELEYGNLSSFLFTQHHSHNIKQTNNKSLAKIIKQELCVKMIYTIARFVNNAFPHQRTHFNSAHFVMLKVTSDLHTEFDPG